MTRSSPLFDNLEQERAAFRVHRKQLSFEYKALQSALDVSVWQDGVSVRRVDASADPTARFTNRHRLVWDVFAPFYNCPLTERVGTPAML